MTKFFLLTQYPKVGKKIRTCCKKQKKGLKEQQDGFKKLNEKLKEEFDIKKIILRLKALVADQKVILDNINLTPAQRNRLSEKQPTRIFKDILPKRRLSTIFNPMAQLKGLMRSKTLKKSSNSTNKLPPLSLTQIQKSTDLLQQVEEEPEDIDVSENSS